MVYIPDGIFEKFSFLFPDPDEFSEWLKEVMVIQEQKSCFSKKNIFSRKTQSLGKKFFYQKRNTVNYFFIKPRQKLKRYRHSRRLQKRVESHFSG